MSTRVKSRYDKMVSQVTELASSIDNPHYKEMRKIYQRKGLNEGTLIIGGKRGQEVSPGFNGAILDIDRSFLNSARRSRRLSEEIRASAVSLPFRDGAFENVVLSLVLSQIEKDSKSDAREAFSEALRVARKSVLVIDTTTAIPASPFIPPIEYFDISRYSHTNPKWSLEKKEYSHVWNASMSFLGKPTERYVVDVYIFRKS